MRIGRCVGDVRSPDMTNLCDVGHSNDDRGGCSACLEQSLRVLRLKRIAQRMVCPWFGFLDEPV
jgi:hypothetical protein